MELYKLSKSQNNLMSIIKGGTILSLLSLLPQLDNKSARILSKKKFSIQFIVPGGESCFLTIKNGTISLTKGIRLFPALIMLFPGSTDFNKLFLSAGGKVIPLPGSITFLSAIKTFQSLMVRLQFFMGSDSDNKESSLILLLNAALEGVCRVAENDPYVEKRLSRIPNGIIEVSVQDTNISCWIEKQDRKFSKYRGFPKEKANAKLIFKDMETAFGVFTGKINATVALGMTDISIRGKLSMIQGLFPLLDRFGFYMAVTKDTE